MNFQTVSFKLVIEVFYSKLKTSIWRHYGHLEEELTYQNLSMDKWVSVRISE